MARLARVEVWSAPQAAGGIRMAVVGDLLAARTLRTHQDLSTLTVTMPVGSSAQPALVERRILRTVWADATWEEWIITGITEARGPTGVLVTVTAQDMAMQLATVVCTRGEADGSVSGDWEALGLTATQHLTTFVIPALQAANMAWVSLGTIAPQAKLDLVYGWDSPLAVVKRLAELTGSEWRVRADGTTGYRIDLVPRVGSVDVTLDARLGRNLTGVTRTRSSLEQVTRCYPRGVQRDDGSRATMARNRWLVTAVSGSTLTLADPAGGDGPVAFDGQLVGLRLRRPGTTSTAITATTASTQAVVVASAAGITANALVEILNSADGDLLYLDDPTMTPTYGVIAGVVDRPDMSDSVNLIANPFTRP